MTPDTAERSILDRLVILQSLFFLIADNLFGCTFELRPLAALADLKLGSKKDGSMAKPMIPNIVNAIRELINLMKLA